VEQKVEVREGGGLISIHRISGSRGPATKSCKQLRFNYVSNSQQFGAYISTITQHYLAIRMHVKRQDCMAYFCTECYSLNDLLEYFNLFKEIPFDTVLNCLPLPHLGRLRGLTPCKHVESRQNYAYYT